MEYASIERELHRAGFRTVRSEVTGLPLDVIAKDAGKGKKLVSLLDRMAVTMRPTLFGYQFLYHCEMSPAPVLVDESPTAR